VWLTEPGKTAKLELRIPRLCLDASWEPETGPGVLESLLRGVADPAEEWKQAFEARIEEADLEGSTRIIEFLQTGEESEAQVDSLVAQQEHAEREARGTLDRDLEATQSQVEEAVASGLLPETERLELTERIERVRAEMIDGLGFNRAHAELQEIRNAVLETSNRELLRTRSLLESLALSSDDPRRNRIEVVIRKRDVWSANEYIDRVQRGAPLPEETGHRRVFLEFWPERASQIGKELERRKLSRLEKAITSGEPFADLPLESLEADARERGVSMLRAWRRARNGKRIDPQVSVELLEALGFDDPKVKLTEEKRFTWISVEADPVADRRLIPVPHFGSHARGRYRILCVWDEPSDDDLIRRVGETAHGAPVLVFYFGTLSQAKRRGLARLCLEQHRTFVVLDDLLMVFLAAEKGTRLPVLFACSLPFTWLEPYATTAGLVPPEMFYGRQAERESIQDPLGSCFIYGGRQLGKTALLRDVERSFHQTTKGRVAKWIDLKAEGIGYDRVVSEVWRLIARELKQLGVVPSSLQSQARPERIQKAVVEWIDSSPDRRVLLLLDEADAFLTGDGQDEFSCSTQLKGLMDRTDRRFKVVFAGLHNVQRSVRSANHPLAHYGVPICVGPLIERGQWADARDLVELPIETMGFLFDSQDLITRILSQANYYPSLLQLYCQQLLRHVADPRSLAFDDRKSPPSLISGAAVDEAYRNIGEAIRQRLQWTLQLDERYEVLAYALALEYTSAGSEGLGHGRPASWFREEALFWWSDGFAGDRGGDDAIRSILDEMVGLGVFREVERGSYSFRSPNVVSLLGTKQEIERELERERESPLEYAPSHFRRSDPQNAARRSPLTVEQEEGLRARRNGVSIVFGWELAGIDDLHGFLLSLFGEARFAEVDPGTNLQGFGERVHTLADRGRGEGTTLLFVRDDLNWTAEWAGFALERCRSLRSREKCLRVLFAAGPERAWKLLGVPETDPARSDEVERLTLKPWSDDALRQWLDNIGIPFQREQRKLIAEATGGWPRCLYMLRESLGESAFESGLVLERARETAVELARATSVVQSDPGELDHARRLLEALGEWAEPVAAEELNALIDEENPTIVARAIRWGELLGLIRSAPDGGWTLNPVVSRAVSAAPE